MNLIGYFAYAFWLLGIAGIVVAACLFIYAFCRACFTEPNFRPKSVRTFLMLLPTLGFGVLIQFSEYVGRQLGNW
jgi:hypothetical protein